MKVERKRNGGANTVGEEDKVSGLHYSLQYEFKSGKRVKKYNYNTGLSVLYFGELYEVRGSAGIIQVFAGNKRVASVLADGRTQFYHTNHLGSASVITDGNGAKKEKMEYFPFGTYKETVDYDSNFPDVFYTFTGQEDDDDLGFYNYVARLYDPVLGRFISPDIIVQNIEYPQTPNRYSYATNNPLRYVDPTGNQYESYDTNLWLSSIYGPLGSFGSSSYLNSNFGSPWKLDINIPNFNISSVSNIGLSSNINLNFSNTNFSNTYNRGALEIGSFGAQYVANNPSSLKETINSLADKFQSWWKDPLGTKARGDRRDYGYGDINLTSIGLFHIFGGTISVQITPEGYVYFCPGVAVGTKGTNLSGTMSNYDPSPGIILAGQVNLGLVGQLGYSFEGKSFFGELGGTLQTGFSVTCMYCLGPFGPFDAGRK